MTTEPEAIPADVMELAEAIANRIGVTPTSESRPYVIRAAELEIMADRASRAPVDGAEAEPVAWRVRERPGSEWTLVRSDPDRDPHFHCWEKQPLYTHPAPASPDAEMVEEAAILERLADRYAEVGQSGADGMANLLRDEARHLRKKYRVQRTVHEALSKHEGDQS